jgi:hypothetical protein
VIEFLPFGDNSKAEVIAEGYIANDGTGSEEYGNYTTRFREKSPTTHKWQSWRVGKITEWQRCLGPLWIFRRALTDLK